MVFGSNCYCCCGYDYTCSDCSCSCDYTFRDDVSLLLRSTIELVRWLHCEEFWMYFALSFFFISFAIVRI